MPLYEYVCRSCGDAFEALVRGEETPRCPGCESGDLSRLLSVTASPASGSGSEAPAGECGRPACARRCMGMG